MEGEVYVDTHRIADIIFRTSSTETLPGLGIPPYSYFEDQSGTMDVRQFIRRIEVQADPGPLSGRQNQIVATRSSFSPSWLENSILRSHPVRRQLLYSMDRPGRDIDLTVDDNHVSIRDFSRRQFHLFYTSTSGGHFPCHGGYLPEHYVKANLGQIFSAFLPCFDAFLLHSAGLVMGDRAVLFIAPDEGGKSTVVRSARGHGLLSEDQIMLREKQGIVSAHSTPFGGPCEGTLGAEVQAVFLLKKAEEFRISKAMARDVIPYLWAEHQNRIFLLSKTLKVRAFELFSKLCTQASLFHMAFPKDHVDWGRIQQLVAGHDID